MVHVVPTLFLSQLVFSFLCPIESTVDLESETDQCEDIRFVKWLAKKKQLLGIPPSAFYSAEHKHFARNYIRFNFYKKTETLEKAKEILKLLQAPNQK